jgi:hypothetical protein
MPLVPVRLLVCAPTKPACSSVLLIEFSFASDTPEMRASDVPSMYMSKMRFACDRRRADTWRVISRADTMRRRGTWGRVRGGGGGLGWACLRLHVHRVKEEREHIALEQERDTLLAHVLTAA